jgi:pimeloyl-ACP methyl ester carboxylesterase
MIPNIFVFHIDSIQTPNILYTMSDLPTLVLVPGSWHRPTCYDPIIKILHNQFKLKCIAITLPSTTGNPNATFKDDIDAARTAISSETSQGHNVVVIAHSYGGMVGNSAIKNFTQPRTHHTDSHSTTTTGHVIGIILIASGFTLTGLSFMDPLFGIPPPAWRVNKDTGYADLVTSARELFYHDLPAADAEYWVEQLTTQSLKALFEGGEHAYAGWKDVPAWYIGTVEDRGLPVFLQRVQVGMARGMGGQVVHREVRSSHSPFLSMPETTAGIVWEAVRAFMGREMGREEGRVERRRDLVVVPGVRLWRMDTWVRFGLPLGFGRVVGNCISLFAWVRGLFGGKVKSG